MNFIVAILSYLIGAIPFSYILPKIINKVDVTMTGSNNPGFTNVFRTVGIKTGILTLVLDILKGFLPTFIAASLLDKNFALIAAFFAVLGHCFPIYMRFKGGKGVATSAGVILALSPMALLILFVLQVLALIVSGYMSLASVISAASFSIYIFFTTDCLEVRVWAVCLSTLVILRHHANIKRLCNGTEPKIRKNKK